MSVIDELTMTTSYMHLAIFICNFIKTCILNEQYQNIDLLVKNEITKLDTLIVFIRQIQIGTIYFTCNRQTCNLFKQIIQPKSNLFKHIFVKVGSFKISEIVWHKRLVK